MRCMDVGMSTFTDKQLTISQNPAVLWRGCQTCQNFRDFSERETHRYFEEKGWETPLWSFLLSLLAMSPFLAYPGYCRSHHSNKPTSRHSTVGMFTHASLWANIQWKRIDCLTTTSFAFLCSTILLLSLPLWKQNKKREQSVISKSGFKWTQTDARLQLLKEQTNGFYDKKLVNIITPRGRKSLVYVSE